MIQNDLLPKYLEKMKILYNVLDQADKPSTELLPEKYPFDTVNRKNWTNGLKELLTDNETSAGGKAISMILEYIFKPCIDVINKIMNNETILKLNSFNRDILKDIKKKIGRIGTEEGAEQEKAYQDPLNDIITFLYIIPERYFSFCLVEAILERFASSKELKKTSLPDLFN